MILRCLALILVLLGAGPQGAQAHALQPGFLDIQPLDNSTWRITWRVPQVAGRPMPIEAVLPGTCEARRAPPPQFDGRAFVSGWITRCDDGLAGQDITVEGLERTSTDVLVRFVAEPEAGVQSFRLTPSNPGLTLPIVPSAWSVLASYFALGLDHIAGGIDHLLFVLALLLLIPDLRRLVGAITAFTVAHSITLAASTLNWVSLPMPPVEAVIALSIVFLACELLARQDGAPRLSERHPWSVAFLFGLLHGMGFASALREIGVPEGDVALSLLAFNLGVEAGQILFVAIALAAFALLQRLVRHPAARISDPNALVSVVLAYGIGSLAMFWTIERIMGFVA